MTDNINTFFEKNKENKKTFKEIKIALKVLLNDTKKLDKNNQKDIKTNKKLVNTPIIKNEENKAEENKKTKPNKSSKNNDLKKSNWEKVSSKYLKEGDNFDYFEKKIEINEIVTKKNTENKNIEIDYNKNIIDTFNDFYDKQQIPNLSKEELLQVVDWDYDKAITMILIYNNEQGQNDDYISRKNLKSIVRNVDDIIGTHIVDSLGKWQIKPNAIGNDELDIFFDSKNIEEIKILKIKDKELFNTLKEKYNKNQNLDFEGKKELLENEGLSTLLVNNILEIKEKRIYTQFKKIFNIKLNKNKLNNQKLFFYTTQLANAYHMGSIGAVRGELFTNVSLKIAEKLNILKTKKRNYKTSDIFIGYKTIETNYQTKLREKYKGFLTKLVGKTNFYKRNTEIQKETIKLIIENLDNKFYKVNNLNKVELKTEIEKTRINYIPQKIIDFIKILSKQQNINPIDLNIKDYKNTNPNKAILVGNYGPRAWRKLNKIQ